MFTLPFMTPGEAREKNSSMDHAIIDFQGVNKS